MACYFIISDYLIFLSGNFLVLYIHYAKIIFPMELEDISKKLAQSNKKVLVLKESIDFLLQNPKLVKNFWQINEIPFLILDVITESFYILNTPHFSSEKSEEVKICIDVLKILVEDADVRSCFFNARLDCFIHPFLISSHDSLTISALELFSTLFKKGANEILKGTELLPLLLKIVDSDSEKCQFIALETMELILIDGGLDYAVQTIDRFQAIDVVLSDLLSKSIASSNKKLVKILLKIYFRLCEKPNVYQKLKEKIPEGLESKEMLKMCEEDSEIKDLRDSSFFKGNQKNITTN